MRISFLLSFTRAVELVDCSLVVGPSLEGKANSLFLMSVLCLTFDSTDCWTEVNWKQNRENVSQLQKGSQLLK